MSQHVASNYFVMLLKDIINTVIRSQTHGKHSIFDLMKISQLQRHKRSIRTLKANNYNVVSYKKTMTAINTKRFCFNSA